MQSWQGKHLLILSAVIVGAAVILLAIPLRLSDRPAPEDNAPAELPPPEPAPSLAPTRAIPDAFPSNTHRPNVKESIASGAIDLGTFSAGRDLMYIDDARVWWESDNDTNDTEDDHTIHASLELPLRRLIELVTERGGTLKVQDCFRASGVHNKRSLHKEGRAIDLTCDELGLETLARLCWAAGFDWVYHERRSRGGAHVHCSVKR